MSLGAPYGLAATAAGSSAINLGWTNGDTYKVVLIERKSAGGAYSQVGSITGSQISYSSTGLSGGVRYYFRIRGGYDAETSDYSNEATAYTSLQAPTNCNAIAASSTSVTITWTDNSTTETGFSVWMNGVSIATTAANVTTFTKTGLSPGGTYSFKVRAENALTYSAYSNTDTIMLLTAPTAPTGLTATANGQHQVDLVWVDNSDNEAYFSVWRKTGEAGTYAVIKWAAANAESYSDTGLDPGTLYYYKVRANNAAGDSAFAGPVGATTDAAGDPATLTNTGQQNISIIDLMSITVTNPVTEYDVIGTDGYTYKLGDYDSDNGYPVSAYFRTKDMDFADQDNTLLGTGKTIRKFRLLYEDIDTTTPVTIYISNDGGINWGSLSANLGAGTGAVKTHDFWFQTSPYATGLNFTFKIESLSTTTNFKWLGYEIEYLKLSEHFTVT